MHPSRSNTFCLLILLVTSSCLIYLSECSVDPKVGADPTSGYDEVPKDTNESTTDKPVVVAPSGSPVVADVKSVVDVKAVVDCETLLPGQYLCNELASIDPVTQQPAGINNQ